jgi:hypothetical protein
MPAMKVYMVNTWQHGGTSAGRHRQSHPEAIPVSRATHTVPAYPPGGHQAGSWAVGPRNEEGCKI